MRPTLTGRILLTVLATVILTPSLAYACPIWIMSPEDGQKVSGTVEVQADAECREELESVAFLIEGQLAVVVWHEPFSVWWDTTTVKDGKHCLRAVGTWSNRYVASSEDVCVTVRNGPGTLASFASFLRNVWRGVVSRWYA